MPSRPGLQGQEIEFVTPCLVEDSIGRDAGTDFPPAAKPRESRAREWTLLEPLPHPLMFHGVIPIDPRLDTP